MHPTFAAVLGILGPLVVVLALMGLALWGISQIPMDASFQRFIRVVFIVVGAVLLIVALVLLLRLAGLNLWPG